MSSSMYGDSKPEHKNTLLGFNKDDQNCTHFQFNHVKHNLGFSITFNS